MYQGASIHYASVCGYMTFFGLQQMEQDLMNFQPLMYMYTMLALAGFYALSCIYTTWS